LFGVSSAIRLPRAESSLKPAHCILYGSFDAATRPSGFDVFPLVLEADISCANLRPQDASDEVRQSGPEPVV